MSKKGLSYRKFKKLFNKEKYHNITKVEDDDVSYSINFIPLGHVISEGGVSIIVLCLLIQII